MRHPFDGIIIPESEAQQSPSSELRGLEPSRRSALRWLLSLPTALFGLTSAARSAHGQGLVPKQPRPEEPLLGGKEVNGPRYDLYFVVPNDVRALSPQRREELNILGKLLRGWPTRNELRHTACYSAWLLPTEAERLRREQDIRAVLPKTEDDVLTSGSPNPGDLRAIVPLAPNGWRTKPPPGTYLSVRQVAKQWSRQFATFRNVRVRPATGQDAIQVSFGNGPVSERVLEAIRSHPQVSLIRWASQPTTLAVGEEGGVRPPVPTTRALAEEGGWPPQVTTRAIGEEGGRPPQPTTLAVGEEGGQPPAVGPTTRALGEEGGGP
jgi:hypothetical protein